MLKSLGKKKKRRPTNLKDIGDTVDRILEVLKGISTVLSICLYNYSKRWLERAEAFVNGESLLQTGGSMNCNGISTPRFWPARPIKDIKVIRTLRIWVLAIDHRKLFSMPLTKCNELLPF